MRFLDEYRNQELARALEEKIREKVTQSWVLMEICGGQTHTIVKYGIEHQLSPGITFIHGPGCPVCVTPLEMIDKAIAIAGQPGVILASYGDLLRVPGSRCDLLSVKAEGGDVRIVYSPMDALTLARRYPEKQVVFFAVGFETTAPANGMAAWQAKQELRKNFSILCSHVRVPPAVELILGSEDNRVQGLLAAGHVCTVMGYEEYYSIAERYGIPIVVTGFEPIDILQGILILVTQLEQGSCLVQNQYSRVVRPEGNAAARKLMMDVFEVADQKWRGIGTIPHSGLRLRSEFAAYDAERRFAVDSVRTNESSLCIAGRVLQGKSKPCECPAFGTACVPEHPLGAPMVSSEGACAAYYHYARHGLDDQAGVIMEEDSGNGRHI